MPNLNNLPNVVYLNKSYDVWMRDAATWVENKGWIKDKDFYQVISETAYWMLFDNGRISQDTPVYFVKDILTQH